MATTKKRLNQSQRQSQKLIQRIVVASSVSVLLIIAFVIIFNFGNSNEAKGSYLVAQSTSAASGSGGSGSPWSGESNVYASNNSYSTTDINKKGSQSKNLEITDFSFSVPASASILGIEVSVEKKGESSDIEDFTIMLTKDGSNGVGSNYAETGIGWSTSDAVVDYGAIDDLWGTSWTPSEVNSASFGLLIRAKNTNTGSKRMAYIDFVEITVHYAEPSPGGVSSNLGMWLKADVDVYENSGGNDAVEDNDNVLVWKDQSGNGIDVSSAGSSGTLPNYSLSKMNFNPTVRFTDDGDRFLKSASNPANGDGTWFVVYKSKQNDNNANFHQNPAIVGAYDNSSSNDYSISQTSGKPFFKATSGSNFGAQSSTAYNNNRPVVLSASRVQSTSATNYLYLNGVQSATYSSDNSTLSTPGTVGIGNHNYPVSGSQFDGNIAEVIHYSSVLSQSDRYKVETYLACKYGITLDHDYVDAAGTTIWDATANATYHNRITFIGREDGSTIDQRQARNREGAVITIGLGSIASSNSANSNAFSADRSYVIFGDDNDVLTGANETDQGTTVNAEVIDRRISRTWKLQEAGTVGTVKMKINLKDFPGVADNFATYDFTQLRLLVDADGVFATGATSVSPTTYTTSPDTTITFDYDFSSGTSYFTLATLDESGSPLPVEFIYFNAEEKNKGVELTWATAMELNNDYFEIQRSNDGLNWDALEQIEGFGTTKQQQNYIAYDQAPMSGLNYYRLKQVDFDGTVDYSDVRQVEFNEGISEPLQVTSVYPNPFTDFITIEFQSPKDGVAQLQLFNSSGVLLQTQTQMVYKGLQNVKFSDLSSLETGAYVLVVSMGEERVTKTLLKK